MSLYLLIKVPLRIRPVCLAVCFSVLPTEAIQDEDTKLDQSSIPPHAGSEHLEMLLLATDDVIALLVRDDESQSSVYRGNTRTGIA